MCKECTLSATPPHLYLSAPCITITSINVEYRKVKGYIVHKDDKTRINLLTDERRERILSVLKRDGRVLATDLSILLGVSDDTIRRDLDVLAEKGLLQRVHGGGLLPGRIKKD